MAALRPTASYHCMIAVSIVCSSLRGRRMISLCRPPVDNWCLIQPCKWCGHLDVTTVMATAMICVTADAERCHLPLGPPFTGHPIPGQTVVAETPCDFPAVNTWSIEDVRIITVGHDFHGDSPVIVGCKGSHMLMGALGLGGNCRSLSQSLLQVLPKLRQDTTR